MDFLVSDAWVQIGSLVVSELKLHIPAFVSWLSISSKTVSVDKKLNVYPIDQTVNMFHNFFQHIGNLYCGL